MQYVWIIKSPMTHFGGAMMRAMLVLCLALALSGAALGGVEVRDAVREVDARSQLLKETTTYTLKNTGSGPEASFVVGVAQVPARVSFAKAHTKDGKSLNIARTELKGRDAAEVYYQVTLASPLSAGSETTVNVEFILTHVLSPHPKEITQSEQQFVVLETSSRVLSPYAVVKQKSTIRLPPGNLESFSKDSPSKHEGETVVYGSYDNEAAFTVSPVKLHMENNSPFLVVNELERVIEVSNWGNIAVEETVRMSHEGAKLKGSFSRFEFQRDRRERMPAVQMFKTILPASARDVYYRDEIGNISTSNLRELDEAVELEIRPRFPLFGGWKTNYYIGYNVPSYEYLFASGSQFLLKMRFVDHIYDNMVLDDMSLKIILPENAKNVKLTTPYGVERAADSIHHTYLDTSGRPVVVARKRNLVEGHIQDFELSYTFERMSMVREPLMLIVAFYLLFLAIIFYVRLDFTIAKDAGSESRLRVSGLVEKISNESAERQAAYDLYADAINKYKANKDVAAFNAARKKADNMLKTASGAIGELQAQLKAESAESAEKISELTKQDKTVRETLTNWATSAERLVGGKLNKSQFADSEKVIKAKLDEIRDKMDSILYSL